MTTAKNEPSTADTEVTEEKKQEMRKKLEEYLKKSKEERKQKVKVSCSEGLYSWLDDNDASLLFSTKATSKIFAIGLGDDNKISIGERDFSLAGSITDGPDNSLFISSGLQLWRLINSIPSGKDFKGFDRFYLPQQSFMMGELGIQDMQFDTRGVVLFASSLFSCIATLSPTHSFIPIWQPKFISKLCAENRCHLTGLALDNNKPKYVTLASETDSKQGWLENFIDRGVIIDVTSNTTIASGLTLPRCPRLYKEKLWILNSGAGSLGYIDITTGSFEEVTACPGMPTSLDFINNYAIVGVSRPKQEGAHKDLSLWQSLEKDNQECSCGVYIINLDTGKIEQHISFDAVINEVFSVKALRGAKRPMLIGPNQAELATIITIGSLPKPVKTISQEKH